MIFTVLGAVAELERSLIAERVRAGLRNAKAKGKRLGRPRAKVFCVANSGASGDWTDDGAGRQHSSNLDRDGLPEGAQRRPVILTRFLKDRH
jgi:DNA invertase Pin-like site-specific DNA recombinase